MINNITLEIIEEYPDHIRKGLEREDGLEKLEEEVNSYYKSLHEAIEISKHQPGCESISFHLQNKYRTALRSIISVFVISASLAVIYQHMLDSFLQFTEGKTLNVFENMVAFGKTLFRELHEEKI